MDKNILLTIVVLAIIALLYVVIRVLTMKYGKDKVNQTIYNVKEGIEKADSMLDGVSPLLPAVVVNVADAIIRYAYVIVSAVEQGYKNGTIEKDIRKDKAMEKMVRILKLAGVEVTEEMTPVIDDAVESAVKNLPKTHVDTTSKSKKS